MATKDWLDVIGDDLRRPEFAAEYLQECLDDGMETFLVALRDVARANGGLSSVARATALSRESMYRALSENGNPEFRTIDSVLRALGVRITLAPASGVDAPQSAPAQAAAAV